MNADKRGWKANVLSALIGVHRRPEMGLVGSNGRSQVAVSPTFMSHTPSRAGDVPSRDNAVISTARCFVILSTDY